MLAVLLALSVSSCNDWLKLEPQNDITVEDFWKSKTDIRTALNSGYIQLRSQVNTLFLWGDIRSDFVVQGPSDEDFSTPYYRILNLEILDNNEVLKWGGIYKVVNYANTVIKYAPDVRKTDLSLTKKELNAFLAEAYFQRALSYFYLVRTFKEVPLYLEPTDTDDVDIFLEKSDEETVLAQIRQDLEWAERYAPRGFDTGLEYNKGFATKAAVQALLADVYLWSEMYAECKVMCDKIINRSTFALMERDQWSRIFEEGNTHESIFEIQFDKGKNQQHNLYKLFGGSNGSNFFDPSFLVSPQVEDLYDANDIRGDLTIIDNSAQGSGLWVGKFYGGGKFSDRDANWIVYRYADILLMKAEALVHMGDFFAAQKELNKVRKRAGLGPKILAGDRNDAEDAILEERGLEFAFEGKRWFDLLRVGKRNNFERKSKLISVLTARVEPTEIPKWQSLLSDPMSLYLPIHIDELRSNLNLKQNPYYE
ncbi:membrane protein [Fulvitalea axinellae]|uniref:Membrane protein n=2 Tax=Fulvitalea axinellae TaxID=1182444 RepID=A0AAU9D632_9BACT|nr:membrane protein [Fulvitalea axinellae]